MTDLVPVSPDAAPWYWSWWPWWCRCSPVAAAGGVAVDVDVLSGPVVATSTAMHKFFTGFW